MTLSGLLSNFSGYIYLACFVLFYTGSAFAIYRSQDQTTRRVFVSGLIVVALAVNIVGLSLLPVSSLHKYTSPPSQEESVPVLYLADENGAEIRLDNRAISPIDDRSNNLAQQIVAAPSRESRIQTAMWILFESRDFRTTIGQNRVGNSLDFPPPSINHKWTTEELRGVGEFTSIRIYRVQISFTEGHEVDNRERTLVVEITPENNVVRSSGER